jgi:ribonuclease HI
MNMTTVYTDGGAAPSNPGPGGYAAVLASGEEYFGYVPHATNNVCEILGLIFALEKTSGALHVVADSSYLIGGASRLHKRKANLKLWTRLDVLLHGRHVTFEKVDRNGGCPGNERADELCGVARALRRGSS